MNGAWDFSQVDFLYSRYQPLTPYGRLDKDAKKFFASQSELETEYELTGKFAAFLRGKEFAARKLQSHLKNIPFLDFDPAGAASAAEIFIVKKFLHNAEASFALLPEPLARALNARWTSGKLLELLRKGGGDETFHLADAYSPELARLRKALRAMEAELSALKKARHAEIKKRFGPDFECREFAVLPENKAARLYSDSNFFIEPYDSTHVTVRPVYGERYLRMNAEKDKLLQEEKKAETGALRELGRAIAAEKPEIERYAGIIRRIDVLLAKAALAEQFGLSRPEFGRRGEPLKITGARFLPLAAHLKDSGLEYTPLSCEFKDRVAVIHGSNMGGKTVALKTAGFLQLLAQHGFFVPATKFRTSVFERVHYIGDGACGRIEGLSGFGLEIFQFVSAYADKNKKCLFLVDEFAKTTNSGEAAALLAAVIGAFAGNPGMTALFSTHFALPPARKNTAYYRMKGFDGQAFGKYMRKSGAAGLESRLGMINRFMRYSLVRDDGKTKIQDALAIAGILGMDGGIIAAARRALEESNEE